MVNVAFEPRPLDGTPYRLVRPLGGGAMGDVYLGEHVRLRRPVVLKILKQKYANDQHILSRFEREGRIVSNLRHPALVVIYDLGTASDGRAFIAMEYLEGEDLRQHLLRVGRVEPARACMITAMACDGLEAAHGAGVLHRDVKPENLFLARDGTIKLLDFGIAKPQDDSATGARTAAGLVLGTPRYIAPEQAMGRSLSPATDVYGTGCVLFELLTGRPPFDGPDARAVIYRHVHAAPPTLSARLGAPMDDELEALVAQALAKDPAARFAHASWFAEALRRVAARLETGAAERTQIDDVFTKPTVRVDPTAPSSTPSASAESFTRPISAAALLEGVSTTEQAAVVGQTARTELIIEGDTPPAEPEAARATVARAGERSVAMPLLVGGAALCGAVVGLVFALTRPRPPPAPLPTVPAPLPSSAPAPIANPAPLVSSAPAATASSASASAAVASVASTVAAPAPVPPKSTSPAHDKPITVTKPKAPPPKAPAPTTEKPTDSRE